MYLKNDISYTINPMVSIKEYSNQVKRDAQELIESTDLINHLNQFGEVIIGGSFYYDLMWGPDIDILIICDDPRAKSVAALKQLVDLRLFQKYEYGDFVKFKRENRPEAYILNLILPFHNQKWEIEIWFASEYPESRRKIDDLIKLKLDDESKRNILEMKKSRQEKGIDKHSLASVDIYKQVLLGE